MTERPPTFPLYWFLHFVTYKQQQPTFHIIRNVCCFVVCVVNFRIYTHSVWQFLHWKYDFWPGKLPKAIIFGFSSLQWAVLLFCGFVLLLFRIKMWRVAYINTRSQLEEAQLLWVARIPLFVIYVRLLCLVCRVVFLWLLHSFVMAKAPSF